ncbi:MAG: tetratricopeptide repeat protein [Candidatus Eremiobacteraeota bacterium]|nr:tetratricopeptide repeat protein [Candidatus Eremiobacteraeota bacterium]
MFDVRQLLAVLKGKRRRLDTAARAALPIDEGRPEAALSQLDALLESGAVPSARRAFVHNKRGVALMALGQKEQARAAFGDALGASGDFAPALVNVGNMLLEDGEPEAAMEYYRAAIRVDESYAVAYLNFSVALKRVGRASEAAPLLRKALRLEMRRRS